MDDKKLSQLPLITSIDEDALLYAVNSGQSVAIKKNDLMASGIEPNEVIQIGLIEIIDDSGDKYLKIAETPNPQWRINGTVYTRTTESLTLIPFAATGKYRVDIFVGNVFSDIQRIEGVEDDDVGVPPAIPDNTVEITRVNIFGSVIGDPSPPPTGGYIKKLSKQYHPYNISNPLGSTLFLSENNTTFLIAPSLGVGENRLNGFVASPSDQPYDGMDIFIKAIGVDIELVHQHASVVIKFYFADSANVIVEKDKIAHLKYNKLNNRVELVGIASGGGGGLYTIPQSGTDIGKLDLSNPLGLDATTLINEVESLSIHTGSVVGGNITFRSRTTLRPTIAGATEQVYLSEPSANFDNTATYTIVVWKEADKINWLMRKRS